MQWKNVKLIYVREMRDQLRDRRTLFLIAVLPLLLYPLLGMSIFQLTQFLQTHAGRVLLIGDEQLREFDWLPPLIEGDRFASELFDLPEQRDSLRVMHAGDAAAAASDRAAIEPAVAATPQLDEARRLLHAGQYEAVLRIPAGFARRLDEIRTAVAERNSDEAAEFPEPIILYNSANDDSKLAKSRVENALRRWRGQLVGRILVAGHAPIEAAEPFAAQPLDVAPAKTRDAAAWSKILPFIAFLWALTGAFYPAVDLCAGEKERGTLETLLTSPALRREIVWGKLLTVMTFSNATALLNLASMGITGKFVIDQLNLLPAPGGEHPIALPPLPSLLWLAVALVPISALFSALCLACAALARSTKEGQYYLMPIMLISMPLMMLPTMPGVELNLGNSLAPLTGVVLLLRTLIEGQYVQALPYVVPVIGVTLICCLLAIRWAEDQFNRESVLFRESERLELRRWLTHMVRDRGETPSVPQALLCVAVILVVQFFASVALSAKGATTLDFSFLAKSVFISQIACIFAPAAIMTVMLTRNPVRTLMLDRTPKLKHLAAAAALGLLLHGPTVKLLDGLQSLYPLRPEVAQQAQQLERPLVETPNFWLVLLVMAVLPPLCEELAFRGFVLSGLRHLGHKWWAIGLSALAFGAAHLFLQQKISATALGLVIGYLAVQTGSLWPCITLHATHNALQLAAARYRFQVQESGDAGQLSRWLCGDAPWAYHPAIVVACLAAAAAILWSLHGDPRESSSEEQVEAARLRQASSLAAG